MTIYMPKGEAGGEYDELVLPRAALIRSMEIVGTTSYAQDDNVMPMLYLAYGINGTNQTINFNGKSYAPGAFMSSANANILVQLNPVNAGEGDLYDFGLIDSHGNSYFSINSVKPYETDDPLMTRAANVGLYTMEVGYASNMDVNTLSTLDPSTVYALSTRDYKGEQIISKYNLQVNPYNSTRSMGAYKNNDAVIGEETDLTEFTYNSEYVIDYYFTLDRDQNANIERTGAKIDEETKRILTATAPGQVYVTLHYLRNDGMTGTQRFYVDIVLAATESEFGNFTWTMSSTGNQYASVIVEHDNVLADYLEYYGATRPTTGVIFAATYEYANASDQAKFEALVPGAEASDGLGNVHFTRLQNDADGYPRWEARIDIDRTQVAPTTFNVSISIPGDDGQTLPDRTVNCTLTVNEPAASSSMFNRLSAYFDGDQATAYGEPANNKISYNLYDLFAEISLADQAFITFNVERPTYTMSDGTQYQGVEWMTAPGTSDGAITVAKYASVNSGNAGGVDYARGVTATYIPFGNRKVSTEVNQFDLTIKSPLYEGEITYVARGGNGAITGVGADKSVDGGTDATLKLNEIVAEDVFGVEYAFEGQNKDSRVVSYQVYLADDNAKEYLAFKDADGALLTGETTTFVGGADITIAKKAAQTAVVNRTPCQIRVRVTDQWGRTTVSAPVTVYVER